MMAEQPWGQLGGVERRTRGSVRPWAFAADRRRLRVGLVNNMPDAALAATERQFQALVQAAAPERRVEFGLFHVPEIPRSPDARRRLDTRYRPLADVADAGLDALIVTGAEPKIADLRQEPFWPALAGLADWSATAGPPSLWSCLAAHVAVLHLDGVVRRPLAAKCSGVFVCAPTYEALGARDPMLEGLGETWRAPHSRANGLDEAELRAHGYRILTRSPEAGVDAFLRRRAGAPTMLMLQGHLEYEPSSLALEFKRDLQRFLAGERDQPPELPKGVFAAETAARLQALTAEALEGLSLDLALRWPTQSQLVLTGAPWRRAAARLVRNWLTSSNATWRTAADPFRAS